MTGEPSYIELGVRDPDAAIAFYGQLFGWQVTGPGQVDTSPGFGRWIECADDQGVRFGLRRAE